MMEQNNVFGFTCLIEELDKNVFVILTDGKHIVGKLVSFDKFGNIVLEGAAERYYSKHKMTELDMGCMIGEFGNS
jgi:U6 snRNA-associated Sm-like protein LSm1